MIRAFVASLSRPPALLFGLAIVCGPPLSAFAQEQDQHPEQGTNAPTQANPSDASGAWSSADFLAAADRISLRFMGYPELTGDYRVGPDQSISIPVIGRVKIADLDAERLEKILAAKLLQITKKDSYVTVEISAYKPIFVTGAVMRPGAIEWRPGMTVIQAVSLTGGVGASVGTVGLDGAPQTLEKDIDILKRNLATTARLTAERDETPEIAVPQQLVSLVGNDEAERLIGQQSDILKKSREALKDKLSVLEQNISDSKSEVQSLRDQSAKITEQLRLRKDYLRKIGSLRPEEEQLRIADLEEKLVNIGGNIAKSNASIGQLQVEAVGIKKDRELALLSELGRLEQERAQLEIGIKSSGRSVIPSEGKIKAREFQIVRQKDGLSITLPGEPGTQLQPGDTLSVTRP